MEQKLLQMIHDTERRLKVQPFYGTDGQSASSLLTTLSSWGSNHTLSGICYLAFRITWDADKYTGIPNIKVKIQGKRFQHLIVLVMKQQANIQQTPHLYY